MGGGDGSRYDSELAALAREKYLWNFYKSTGPGLEKTYFIGTHYSSILKIQVQFERCCSPLIHEFT